MRTCKSGGGDGAGVACGAIEQVSWMVDRGTHNPFQAAAYLCTATSVAQLPPDEGREVAFAGRSNAGKSSALNGLTGRRALARTGKLPGRTRALNFFSLDPACRLVDLPGYGFARVPAEVQRGWARLVESYLSRRASLGGLVLLMDIRHPFRAGDRQLLDWCDGRGLAVQVVLTKSDKLSRSEVARTLAAARSNRPAPPPLAFSATRGEGAGLLRAQVATWLGIEIPTATMP